MLHPHKVIKTKGLKDFFMRKNYIRARKNVPLMLQEGTQVN